MRDHRITNTYFRICSKCLSLAVKLPYAFALDGWFPNQPEGNLCACLRYFFGRRPPQSNYPPDNVLLPVYGNRVRDLKKQGWYFNGRTPPALAYGLLCLPPILHMQFQIPMSSYSKGAQGLSVFFCGNAAFSPRFQFHRVSGRDSVEIVTPFVQVGTYSDKEFRYLRTVIVTAAVYRGFRLKLRLR